MIVLNKGSWDVVWILILDIYLDGEVFKVNYVLMVLFMLMLSYGDIVGVLGCYVEIIIEV